MEPALKKNTTQYWVDILNKGDVPSGDILSLESALNAPQIKHRETIQTVNEPKIGDMKIFSLSAKFEKTPGSVDAPPPRLSAHTVEILSDIGYSQSDVEKMKAEGIL